MTSKAFFRLFLTAAFLAATANLSTETKAASPGALDPTFGTSGKVFGNIGTVSSILGIAVQPDGKIVVAGTIPGANDDFLVVRYNADGSLDTTFDGDGKATTDFFGRHDRAADVAVQPDGKIVVVGSSTDGFSDTAIARYLPDGSLDPTFDGDGRFYMAIGGGGQVGDAATCVLLQSDGKILAGGAAAEDFLVLRLNPDGSLDTSFNGSGLATTTVSGSPDLVKDLVIQTDGKIVAGGGDVANFALVRYSPNGTVDASFGTGGIVKTNFNGFSQATSLAIQSDGKLVAAGHVVSNQYNAAAARYHPNGSLDVSFDGDGKAVINFNPSGADFAADVQIQPNAKIIVSGYAGEASSFDFSVARLKTNGSLDAQFGAGGVVRTDLQEDDSLTASVLYGDKLIVAGDAIQSKSGVKLARYNLSAVPSASKDFDGDGFSDYAVFRAASGTWFVMQSANNTVQIRQFGAGGDVPLNGDFDGDGKSDHAVFRPAAGEWWINKSASGETFAVQFGQAADKPSVGDYDEDGKTDIALWRPADGNWYVLRSVDNFTSYFSVPFGQNGDIPIQ